MDIQNDLQAKVNQLLQQRGDSLGPHLGITYEKFHRDEVIAVMPVDQHTRQPFGYLHGGASLVLAESLASVGAWLNIDETKKAAVGLEINANHLRPVREGQVRGTAVPVHRGTQTHVWQIDIKDENKKSVCTSRCTVAIIDKPEGGGRKAEGYSGR